MKKIIKLTKPQLKFITSKSQFTCMLCSRSCGKTFVASLLAAKCLFEQKHVMIFAQTKNALAENLMTEIRLRLTEMGITDYKYNGNTQKITYKDGIIYGFSYENIEACRGYSKIEVNIFDEIALAPESLLDVASFCNRGTDSNGNMIHPKTYCMTTPRMGSWFNTYVKKRKDINLIRTTIFDMPRTVISQEQIDIMESNAVDDKMKRQELYGEIVEDSSNGVLFTTDLITRNEVIQKPGKSYAIGVDCSGLGKDNNVILVRQENRIQEVVIRNSASDKDLCSVILTLVQKYGKENLSHIAIDEAYGLGLAERLQDADMRRYVTIVPFAGKAPNEGYANNRAYMYCTLKKSMESEGITGLSQRIIEELSATRYLLNTSNKILIIPKDDIRIAIGRSPDCADALALTYIKPLIARGLIEARRERAREFMQD